MFVQVAAFERRRGERERTLFWYETVMTTTGVALWLFLLTAAVVAALASAENTTYVITWSNASSGWCVDLSGGDTSNGTEIQLWDCNVSIHRARSAVFVTAVLLAVLRVCSNHEIGMSARAWDRG